MKIVHIWYGRYRDPDNKRDERIASAQQSWTLERERASVEWVVHHPEIDDTSARIGDPDPMPSVHAIMSFGADQASEDDAIFLTNADVGVVSGITELIKGAIPFGSAHMKRKELGLNSPLGQPTVKQVADAPEYCGMDGLVFTKEWWLTNRHLMPPCTWGRYGWDSAARNLIRWKGGIEIKGALWHREHTSRWNATPDVLYKNPANHQNRLMLWQWILQHGGSDADHLFADGELTYR